MIWDKMEIFAAFFGAFYGVFLFVDPWERLAGPDLLRVIAGSFFCWAFFVFIRWEFAL